MLKLPPIFSETTDFSSKNKELCFGGYPNSWEKIKKLIICNWCKPRYCCPPSRSFSVIEIPPVIGHLHHTYNVCLKKGSDQLFVTLYTYISIPLYTKQLIRTLFEAHVVYAYIYFYVLILCYQQDFDPLWLNHKLQLLNYINSKTSQIFKGVVFNRPIFLRFLITHEFILNRKQMESPPPSS